MGFTPSQVNEMSLWEFIACCDAFRISRGGKPSPADVDDETLRNMGVVGFEE